MVIVYFQATLLAEHPFSSYMSVRKLKMWMDGLHHVALPLKLQEVTRRVM
jgi:hypothetical protein